MRDLYCPRCNSDFLGEDIDVVAVDEARSGASPAALELRALPPGDGKLLTPLAVRGRLKATVCGRCGGVQLFATDALGLASAARAAHGEPPSEDERMELEARERLQEEAARSNTRYYEGLGMLGEQLVRQKLITSDQLLAAHAAQKREGGELGEHLLRLGYLSDERFRAFCRKTYGVVC